MTKEKLKINEEALNQEDKTPIMQDDTMYHKQIRPVATTGPKVGIDVDQEFYDTLVAAAQESKLDIAKLESFTQISSNRNQVYQLIDTMAEDSTIAAVLETYVEDATETNMDGKIVWAEANDPQITKYITYLLETMNVDKNAYKWIYSLTKYGDLYLRLYRESDYNDKLFDSDNIEDQIKHAQSKQLNEDLSKVLEENYTTPELKDYEISREDAEKLDDLNESVSRNNNSVNIINEDVNVKVYAKGDRYAHYIEMVPNPAEMYELTRLGKSYAYIQAPSSVNFQKQTGALDNSYTNRYLYNFKKKDVDLYEATEFVHAALEDNSNRIPEEVNIFLTDNDYESNSNALTYKVKRGQSLLYNSYKTWRELMLLEYSLLLNRVTKSSIVRIIGVEVGDMPKEQIGPHLQGIKSLMEQKASLDVGGSMNEYTNPGPVENNIYVPTHNGIGNISPQQVGGDVNVTGLGDLDYFKNKFFGSLRVPKQFFGDTDDSAGFDAGSSLSIISSRYAKTVKRIQNTFLQAITDALNLMLIDKGLKAYVNKFELHMVAPTTREELDRQDAISNKVGLANDVMMLVGDLPDYVSRLKILKALLNDAVTDPVVCETIQEEIDRLEQLQEDGVELDDSGNPIIAEDESGLTGPMGGGGDLGGFDNEPLDLGGADDLDNEAGDSEGGGADLPSPADLGMDFTDNDVE